MICFARGRTAIKLSFGTAGQTPNRFLCPTSKANRGHSTRAHPQPCWKPLSSGRSARCLGRLPPGTSAAQADCLGSEVEELPGRLGGLCPRAIAASAAFARTVPRSTEGVHRAPRSPGRDRSRGCARWTRRGTREAVRHRIFRVPARAPQTRCRDLVSPEVSQ